MKKVHIHAENGINHEMRIPRGCNFHCKGIYRGAAEMKFTFQDSKYMNVIIFTSKVYQWGIFFSQKVYKGVKFENSI